MINLVNLIKKQYFTSRKTRPKILKKSHKYYILRILRVLKTGLSWRNLECRNIHYTTIHKFYRKLVKLNVFKNVYMKLLQKHCKSYRSKYYFIDSTLNLNFYGIDNISRSYLNKKKNYTKLSVIVNDQGIPSNIYLCEAKKHDAITVHNTIENGLFLKNNYLIGDKGYISPDVKNNLQISRNITMVYPYKKNQKKKNTLIEKQLLNKRHIVENCFSWLKKSKRVCQRYDKTTESYYGFIYLKCSQIIMNKL